MNIRETIKHLCDDKGISVAKLEKVLGLGNGSIMKSDSIKVDKLKKIADYFDVSVDYILAWEDIDWNPETQEITRDLSKYYKKNIIDGKEIHPEYMASSVIGNIMVTPEQKLSERKMKELEELVKLLVNDEDFREKMLDYAFEIKKERKVISMGETQKRCKYCMSMVNKKAKVCPVCRKQLGLSWYHWVIGIVFFMFATGMAQELLGWW